MNIRFGKILVATLALQLQVDMALAKEKWVPVNPADPLDLNIGYRISPQRILVEQGALSAQSADTVAADPSLFAQAMKSMSLDVQPLASAPTGDSIIWVDSSALKSSNKSVMDGCQPLAPADSRALAWEAAYACIRSLGRNEEMLGLKGMKSASLYVVEPVLNVRDERFLKRMSPLRSEEVALSAASNAIGPSRVWPSGQPGWHLEDDYSQLKKAGLQVGDLSAIRVAHLDTGYLPEAESLPEHFLKELSAKCSASICLPGGVDDYTGGLGKMPGHGPATLSTLAGRPYTLNVKQYQLGAAPGLHVFSVDIGDSVIHPDSRRMAQGILYAVKNEADVITMSHGGLPSARLAAAVNTAYENGTPIFSATGDYFDGLFAHSFQGVAYPARYPRVMGVAGVTKNEESYGDDPSWRWLIWPGRGYFSRLGSWALRGNYGPENAMADHVISAYAPNVTRAIPSKAAPGLIGDNGAGTSHATPQAAAAAALWLQKNRSNFPVTEWRSWKKSEAVYSALASSAKTCFADYNVEHYGVGILKAEQALGFAYEEGMLVSPAGKLIALNSRPEADLDLKGVASLIRSTNIYKSFAGNVKEAVIKAATTELTQLAMTSDRVQKILQRTHLCKKVDGCEICRRQDLRVDVAKLASAVQKLKDASPTLKEMLAQAAKAGQESAS